MLIRGFLMVLSCFVLHKTARCMQIAKFRFVSLFFWNLNDTESVLGVVLFSCMARNPGVNVNFVLLLNISFCLL
jgi:hypothetical protein